MLIGLRTTRGDSSKDSDATAGAVVGAAVVVVSVPLAFLGLFRLGWPGAPVVVPAGATTLATFETAADLADVLTYADRLVPARGGEEIHYR